MRLESSTQRPGTTSRELIGRLALQLHLVEGGIEDALSEAPVDVLLSIEPVLDSAGEAAALSQWCARLLAMYRQWSQRRHMQLDQYAPSRSGDPVILQIAGFGAFRRLQAEAGLHLLEPVEGGARLTARVVIAAGPLEDPRAGEAYRSLAAILAKAPDANSVVRRYREKPAPLVRDGKTGWRSGRLDAVLGGDFDLIGEAQR
jgi:ATP-dependent Clp protease ATP-binding subunit ClpC